MKTCAWLFGGVYSLQETSECNLFSYESCCRCLPFLCLQCLANQYNFWAPCHMSNANDWKRFSEWAKWSVISYSYFLAVLLFVYLTTYMLCLLAIYVNGFVIYFLSYQRMIRTKRYIEKTIRYCYLDYMYQHVNINLGWNKIVPFGKSWINCRGREK